MANERGAKRRYEEARAAFEYMESLVQLEDQVELDGARLYLMQNPTKAKAAEMYESAITLWLSENRNRELPQRACEIANKYGLR
jgi:hypothetical protein